MQDFSFIDSKEYLDFISKYEKTDVIKLRLKNFPDLQFDKDFAIRQIECRNRTRQKLPSLYDKIIYPTDISTEQCTSEKLAEFHASLFSGCNKAIDFTSGLGIDSFFISKEVNSLISIELDQSVSETANFNFKKLSTGNITTICDNAEHFAEVMESDIGGCFIDPSRRIEKDKTIRSYGLKDCQPDLSKIVQSIKNKCKFIIVKASPMIDISQTLNDFENISDIWILSVKNDCKELLFKIQFADNCHCATRIHAINYEAKNTQVFEFDFNEKFPNPIEKALPEENDFLLMPNSSVMKSGSFDLLCSKYNLKKVADNSHLFLSQEQKLIELFPGRVFQIEKVLGLSKPDIKLLRQECDSANIICRNFPLSPVDLQKKLKIKDGGQKYIIATTDYVNKKFLAVCSKKN